MFNKRYKSLDFLRGVAVLIVMTGHFLPGYLASHIGWSGVDLFFVLSGFFVSGILFREYNATGKINGLRFLVRRAFKIWPLFYTTILIYVIYYYTKNISFTKGQLFTEIFFIQNYRQGFTVITWSLGIEEQFYIFLTILMAGLLFFKKIKWVVPCCILLMIIVLTIRIINFTASPFLYNPYKYNFPLYLRADTLCAGIIIAYYWQFYNQAFCDFVNKYFVVLTVLSFISLSPLAIYSYQDPFTLTGGFTFVYLGYALLVSVLLVKSTIFTTNKILLGIAWVGFYSYAIYLFHVLVGFASVNFFKKHISDEIPLAILFILFIASNILFGYFASRIVEQPFLRLRERIFPGPAFKKSPV